MTTTIGLIEIGHVVSKVAGESVVTDRYETIVQKLKMAPRPLIVHFIGHRYSNASNTNTDAPKVNE